MERSLKLDDVARTVIDLRDDYIKEFRLDSPHDINLGYCFHFAMKLKEKFPDAVIVDGKEYAHSCVKIGGLYFDSEHPWGEKDYKEILYGECVEAVDPMNPPRGSWRREYDSNGGCFQRAERSNLRLRQFEPRNWGRTVTEANPSPSPNPTLESFISPAGEGGAEGI